MANILVMPKLGLTMSEGVISNWRKQEGDIIKKGEILFDVETDKLTNEYEAINEGILRKILVSGGTVPVLAPVAIIADEDEDITELLNKTGAEESEKTEIKADNSVKPSTMVAVTGGRVKASPRAKKIAAELGVDINLINGTGADGSITENDIKNYSEQ
ncbi:E3 binding domain-containing protein, partial [Sedimentibacter sp.]